jgi:hypothetical protein
MHRTRRRVVAAAALILIAGAGGALWVLRSATESVPARDGREAVPTGLMVTLSNERDVPLDVRIDGAVAATVPPGDLFDGLTLARPTPERATVEGVDPATGTVLYRGVAERGKPISAAIAPSGYVVLDQPTDEAEERYGPESNR